MIDKQIGEKAVLYFGCRNEDDHYYDKQLTEIESKSSENSNYQLSRKTAYSRPKNNSSIQKAYVQQKIENDEDFLRKMVEIYGENNQIWVYVCGRSKDMPNEVEAALQKCGLDTEKMRVSGRYFEETWG